MHHNEPTPEKPPFIRVELVGGPHDGLALIVPRTQGGLTLRHLDREHFYASLGDDHRMVHRPRLALGVSA